LRGSGEQKASHPEVLVAELVAVPSELGVALFANVFVRTGGYD